MTTNDSLGISFGGVSNKTYIFGSGILAAYISNSCLVRVRYSTTSLSSELSEFRNSPIQLNNSPSLLSEAQSGDGRIGYIPIHTADLSLQMADWCKIATQRTASLRLDLARDYLRMISSNRYLEKY